ncbi:MAG: ImmA/IrrE family metallo-endopeptidase [Nitrosopumilaceae archaeon]
MTQQKILVKVKPEIMKWAIDSSGWEIEELAKKLKVTDAAINNWKTRNQEIEIRKLEKLSEFVKRPLAIFFLENPPKESELTDYRKLPHEQAVKLTRNTVNAIRNARYLQSSAEELMKIQGINPKPTINIKITMQTLPEEAARTERKKIGFESEDVLLSKEAKRSIRDFYNVLRRTIESFNIFVFQVSMPIEEVRGVTLSDKFPRVIVINSKDTIQARIFSLLHEYGHVLLRKDGICIPQAIYEKNYSNGNFQHIEKWCNSFAASVLMPKEEFLAEYHNLEEKETETRKIIDILSNKFRTSKQATVIRIKDLEKKSNISYEYQNILGEIRKDEIIRDRTKKKSSGGPGIVNTCISQKGRKFVLLVLESKRNKVINNSDVIDYLNINLKHLKKLQEKAFRIV